MKTKLFKLIFIPIYGIVVIEITIRLILMIDPIFYRILDFDSASERLKWVKRHENVEILYDYETHSPTLGWALQPNLRNVTVGDKVLNTNARGLRGVQEYGYDRTANKRIIVLGDSFTFGMDVSDDETYVAYLDKQLPRVEVLNFGVPGYGHDQMLIYFRDEGVKYRPDIVIIGFVELDLYRNMMNFKNYSKPQFKLDGNKKLYLTNTPVSPPEAFLSREFFRLKTFDLLTILQGKLLWRLGLQEERMNEVSTAILDELIREIENIDATPVLVYLPLDLVGGKKETFFQGYCQNRPIACLSLQEPFAQNIASDAEFRSYTDHWQPLAHKIAAEKIQEFLVEEGLLPDEPSPPLKK